MTTKITKGPTEWAYNDDKYPQKLGTCDHCGDYDRVKLAFDQRRWICLDMADCLRSAARLRALAAIAQTLSDNDVAGFLADAHTL